MDWEEHGDRILNDLLFLKEERIPINKYKKMLHKMHQTEFFWTFSKDKNRAIDGIRLRRKTGYDRYEREDFPCSVLEMLAALAIRIDNEYIGDTEEKHPGPIFWEMICNLGLNLCSDKKYEEEEVEFILNRWLNRRYDPDGNCGIFPLKHPRKDMRYEEIWSQMLSYISENYIM